MGTRRTVGSFGKMPPKDRKNRFKIKCLICTPNVEMTFEHRSKHNLRFHQEMVKRRKHIRYEVVGAPIKPFVATARTPRSNVEQSAARDVTNACVAQDQGIELAERASNDHENDRCLSSEKRLEPEEAQCQSNENLMPTATAAKRPRLECHDVELMECQETDEFDGNVSSDALSDRNSRSSSVKENAESDGIDSGSTVSESTSDQSLVSNEYGFYPLK